MKTTFKKLLTEAEASVFLKDHDQIAKWLNDHEVKQFVINSDSTVSINGPLSLDGKELEEIPVKFKEVRGSIDVSSNKLKRIDWAPDHVQGDFDIWDNDLVTLEGGPTKVEGSYDCDNNNLKSLLGAAREVGKAFICSMNDLDSLAHCPEKVGTYFKAMSCGLTSIDALPKSIGSSMFLQSNKIESFANIAKIAKTLNLLDKGKVNISSNPIQDGLIFIAAIRGIKEIIYDTDNAHPNAKQLRAAVEIINKGLKSGADVFDIQAELEDGGYGDLC